MQIQVYAEPAMLRSEGLRGQTTVVIDALRMTSVAITAVDNGCEGVMPVRDVEDARRVARDVGALLGGERNALPIEGFQLSNSPLEYTPQRVQGRRLVLSTSNGTRAILAAQESERLLLGGFINAQAVADTVRDCEALSILCAGTLGRFTLEDVLAAGGIVDRVLRHTPDAMLDDLALAAMRLYRQADGKLQEALRPGRHYQWLVRHGMQADIDYCLQEDCAQAVPERHEGGWFA